MKQHVSEETREKLRKAHLGRKHSEETKKKISRSTTAFWATRTRKEKRKHGAKILSTREDNKARKEFPEIFQEETL